MIPKQPNSCAPNVNSPETRSKFRRSSIFAWSVLALIALYMAFFGGWADLTVGRYHRRAHEVFNVAGVTEVRVYLLAGSAGQSTSGTFPIRPYSQSAPVYGTVTLTGPQLEEFKSRWETQVPSEGMQALCHSPAYGFRLYRGTRLVVETSVCWGCSNYTVDVWPFQSNFYGFAQTEAAQELLSFCDKLLPYSRQSK
jgi:hypothetical protein